MSAVGKIHDELAAYRPAVWLERVFPQSLRNHMRSFCGTVVAVAVFLYVLVWVIQLASLPQYVPSVASYTSLAFIYKDVVVGIAATAAAVWMLVFALEAFWRTYYLREVNVASYSGVGPRITYAVASIILKGTREDMTESMFAHPYGQALCNRLGISYQSVAAFVRDRNISVPATVLQEVSDGEWIRFADFARLICKHDEAFADFLFDLGIQEDTFYGAADWIQYRIDETKRKQRWWARERLGRISPIGRAWAYGEIYELEKYAKDIRTTSQYSSIAARSGYAKEYLNELEELLQKSKDANALLVGEAGVGKMDVVLELFRELTSGTMMPPLADKRLVILDTNQLIAATGNKTKLERTLYAVFTQAVRAGNIILVLENLPGFIRSAQSAGVEITDIMDRYLESPQLHVIATATPGGHHRVLETKARLMQRFGVVHMKDADKESVIRILINVAHEQEKEAVSDIVFTYQSLQAIATGAERYLTQNTMPDAALNLLLSVSAHAQQHDIQCIDTETVMEVIQQKTGVPVGDVGDKEKEVLVHLEEILHQRVIGQDPAIEAIAGALRNARAGVQDKDKPIGTFLFFGPTGVGKTETTKALAEAYFGGEETIQRIDSSEYSTQQAVRTLVGADGKAGRLANVVREQPYGVLLVDEFEKAHHTVHDLFLQILDEGYFTDGRGKRVNLQNMIIIATSNAGSDIIFEKAKKTGADLQSEHDQIIDAIIQSGIFRPELLNRFDDLILFSPLSKNQLKDIARLQLSRLQERVRQQGYRLEITDPLVDFVVQKGFKPQFGARAMNRVIQDDIEKLIADRLINEEIEKGETIRFSHSHLDNIT